MEVEKMSYSWGSDTSVSSSGGGYSYQSARNAYGSGRTYSSTPSSKKSVRSTRTYRAQSSSYDNSPAGKDFSTDSGTPIVIAMDLTGSMGAYRDTFFKKLPLLWKPDEGITKYFADAEISFAAIGDALGDTRPIQVCEFDKGANLDDKIASMQKQGGCGNGMESYDLTAYFYMNHCQMPKAKNPMFFWAIDERFYKDVDPNYVQTYLKEQMAEPTNTMGLMKNLAGKFDTYVLRKSTESGYGSDHNRNAHKEWQKAFGEENVMYLEEPDRIVDCILGLVAAKAGQFDTYTNLLTARQTKKQVGQVMSSIRSKASQQLYQGTSLRKLPAGKKSIALGS